MHFKLLTKALARKTQYLPDYEAVQCIDKGCTYQPSSKHSATRIHCQPFFGTFPRKCTFQAKMGRIRTLAEAIPGDRQKDGNNTEHGFPGMAQTWRPRMSWRTQENLSSGNVSADSRLLMSASRTFENSGALERPVCHHRKWLCFSDLGTKTAIL